MYSVGQSFFSRRLLMTDDGWHFEAAWCSALVMFAAVMQKRMPRQSLILGSIGPSFFLPNRWFSQTDGSPLFRLLSPKICAPLLFFFSVTSESNLQLVIDARKYAVMAQGFITVIITTRFNTIVLAIRAWRDSIAKRQGWG